MRSVLHLTYLIVFACAKEYLNQTEVSWEAAKKSCSVPQLSMILPSNDYEEDNGFYAWTSTQELFSDWAFFYGCLDIHIPKEDEHRLYTYFSNSEQIFIAAKDDIFKCAIYCTNMNYFVYYITTCLCITSIGTYPVTDSTDCISPCRTDSAFCSSGFGVPLFKYKPEVKVSRRSMFYYSYHCVATKNGYNYDDNCFTEFRGFNCNGIENIGLHTNWINAVNNCTNCKTTLPNAVRNSSAGLWLRYFRYQILHPATNKERRKCIAAFVKNNQEFNSDYIQWSHYQEKNCSELLPFICLGGHKTAAVALVPNSTIKENLTSQFSSRFKETNKKDEMIIVKIILLTSSIGIVVLTIIRLCYQKIRNYKYR
ncbi:unnamed protein product [Mytilus coruscus]|uniref:WSC domain-containing protein n=1 Tax=Mytilus coruscus TaxID=42192 RepID=A0A6J8BYS5_MYTCO|nr:unnamed protein product [Mytilus coruscus]